MVELININKPLHFKIAFNAYGKLLFDSQSLRVHRTWQIF